MSESVRDTCFGSDEANSTNNKWSKLSCDFMSDGPSERTDNNSRGKVADTVDSSGLMKEMNWKRWEHRGDVEDEDDDENDDEYPFHFNFTEEISSSDDEPEDEVNASRVDCEALPHHRYRMLDNTEMNKTTSQNLDNVQNLFQKFSTIETLRRRDKMKKMKENVSPHRKSCSTRSPLEMEKPAMNPEVFLGSKMHSKKRRDEWERRKSPDDDSNEGVFLKDESDKDIDEMVQMLLTSSISAESSKTFTTLKKESDSSSTSPSHKPKEKEKHQYDDCCETLQDYSASDSSGNSSESETQEPSFINHLSDDLNWATDISGDVDTIFDGYNIDHHSSFHDWMIDDILSRPLNSSYNIESSVCEVCGDSDHVCLPQSESLDAFTKYT